MRAASGHARGMHRVPVLAAASVLIAAILAIAVRPSPSPAIAPVSIITVVHPPAVVVTPSPPPPPPPAVTVVGGLGAPPPEPSDRAIEVARATQCAHPDPRRTKEAVLALAAIATGACAPAPYEIGSESIYVCGDQAALDVYTVIACGRCLTYRWYEGHGWSLDEMHRATAPDAVEYGHSECD